MFIIRWFLGRIILLVDFFTRPKLPELTLKQQAFIAQKTENIELYQLNACPFCVKVRRAMRRRGIELPLRNINDNNGQYREQLVAGGGRPMVPCLRIEKSKGQVEWLYESKDIVKYLDNLLSVTK